ncbi:monosaccharide ABC transporter ATP-binding protein (CUT2 family) [Anaerobacterium chartisolvens]|uniref:Monosaccharide ABC transporter ATP-binding protein (CUT2 family) n=1 Tax=Anaerobacterium chartisolvens TaxID=1297424 RepID=A0A369AKI4_9FIRM|nr:sugar ABC transporter ATP-binding protein [Anaerobacterium chartisolvens]RCX09919.1 monosaccharide ABC transporter ATP-binding protein (CUT2 family) [Anaerobacterium chartisolvens]
MDNTVLKLSNITKTYPGVVALNDVSIEFKTGEIHAIMGENGAGKSTLIKVIAGAITPDSGEIIINGKTYRQMTPQEAISNGVSVIYQEFNLFESLTAAENIFIGEKISDKKLVDFKEMNQKAKKIFDKFNVKINPKAQVQSLSPAYKQIVEISKAINKNAKILIMDEPTAPLTMAEVEELFKIVNELKQNGITIIYISHRLDEIFTIADRVSIMRDGKYITTRNIEDTSRKDLISLMVGRELKNSYPQPEVEPSDIALEVKNISGNGIKNANFNVKKGEILGMAGLVGAGRTELMRVLFGADKMESGEILIKGKPVRIKSPAEALELGLGLIPEDRKHHGAFLQNSIEWNICISNIKKISKSGIVNRKSEKDQAKYYCDSLRIKTPSQEQKVLNLSGGNQQKVVLAKVMAANTDILIFDEPTRGIDVGAREEIYHLMRDLANEGKAIIMVSSDMEELLGMSDRIIVMAEGIIKGELTKTDFSQQLILEMASGE